MSRGEIQRAVGERVIADIGGHIAHGQVGFIDVDRAVGHVLDKTGAGDAVIAPNRRAEVERATADEGDHGLVKIKAAWRLPGAGHGQG